MLPKKVKKRASLLAITLLVSVTGIFFILQSLNKNILYFKSPTDIKTNEDINFNKKLRVGGMVKEDSVILDKDELSFVITDFSSEINVTFSGAIPNLFEEGKGVVAEGYLKDRNFFLATKILAKHDENYMPPEVKAALQEN